MTNWFIMQVCTITMTGNVHPHSVNMCTREKHDEKILYLVQLSLIFKC